MFLSCTSEEKTIYNYHKLNYHNFDKENNGKSDDIIYIKSNYNNVSNKDISGFQSLTYNIKTKGKTYLKTEKENRKNYTLTKEYNSNFKALEFILDNYLSGNIQYLQSLHDSFDSADIGSYFYIFDLKSKKAFKINAIVFDTDGKLIQ